jgi:hypothetical protein
MIPVNDKSFKAVSAVNNRMNEYSQQETKLDTTNSRPKTISEVRDSLRPNTAGSILGSLGRPQIGRQLRMETPQAEPIMNYEQPRPQNRRLTQTAPSYAPQTQMLDQYSNNGTRIKQILNLIEGKVWRFGVEVETTRATTESLALREELAVRIKNILNARAGEGALGDVTTEDDLRTWFGSLTQEIGNYILYYNYHYSLSYGSNQTYRQGGVIASGQGFTVEQYNIQTPSWLPNIPTFSHRIRGVFTPQLRTNYNNAEMIQSRQEQKQIEERKQQEQEQKQQEVVVEPSGDVPPPVVPPSGGEVVPSNPSLRPTTTYTDEEFALLYLKDMNELNEFRDRTLLFTQIQNADGSFSGVALGVPYSYPLNPAQQSSVIASTFNTAFNTIIETLSTTEDLIGVSLFGGSPIGNFVWLGPASPNNEYATGIADLVSFYHDCLYAGQGATGASQNVPADILSMKFARIMKYMIACKLKNRVSLFDVRIEVGVEKEDFLNGRPQNELNREYLWLNGFIAAFKLTDRFNPAATTEIKRADFTFNDFLNDTYLIRHMKLKILNIYSIAINERILNLDNFIPDPTYHGFLVGAQTLENQEETRTSDWNSIYENMTRASRKLVDYIARNRSNTDQPSQARMSFYLLLSILIDKGAICIKNYYIDRRKKPIYNWQLETPNNMNEGEKPDEEELKDVNEPVSDIILPYVVNTVGIDRVMFILRNLPIEGIVVY